MWSDPGCAIRWTVTIRELEAMSDYMFVLESHLDASQNRAVNEMQRLATEAGMNVWLTGGAMRDILRGARISDLDFTVERDAVKLGKALAAAVAGTVVSEDAQKRGIELELPGPVKASVFNARTEKISRAGGKAQIAPAGIHEDLLRRDFTINAMALALNRGSRGLLVDPANGQADLTNKELRATNSYIFFDDPARIFRLVRFEHSLGFQLAPRLQSQLDNALLEEYQKSAAVSGLACEIRALATDANAVPALEAYERMGLLKLVSPALAGAKLNAAGLTKFEKLLNSVLPSPVSGGWLAFLTILTEKLSAREKSDVLKVFELSKAEAEGLKQLEAQAKKLETLLKSAKVTRPSHVYEALEGAGADVVLMVLYSSQQRVVQDRIRAYYSKYLGMAQEITEEQVAATGAKPGTPKFEKTRKTMIATHLNARPKKIVEPEPEPTPAQLAAARGGRR
jgi:tRNA nucleotidyltransferase (CCA-adding enzyme)